MIKRFRKKINKNNSIYIVVSSILHLSILVFLLKTYVPGFDKKSKGNISEINEVTGLDKGTDQEMEILEISTPTLSSDLVENKKSPIRLDIIQNQSEVASSKHKAFIQKIVHKDQSKINTKKAQETLQNTSDIAIDPTDDKNLKPKEEKVMENTKQVIEQKQNIADVESEFLKRPNLMENLIDEPVETAHLDQQKVKIPKQIPKQDFLNFDTTNTSDTTESIKQNRLAKINIPKQSNGRGLIDDGKDEISSSGTLKIFQENELVPLTNHLVKYPKTSQSLKEHGTVKVDLHFDRYGQLKNSKITKSSGYQGLDNAVIKGVANLSFRAMGFEFIYRANFHFQLEDDMLPDRDLRR